MSVINSQYDGMVLVAEDNSVNAMVNRVLLEKAGIGVEIAEDGLEAVAKAAERTFDMILMDLSMPNLDGLGAIKQIRAGNGHSKNSPIVLLTARLMDEDDPIIQENNIQGILEKPITVESLNEVLERHLQFKS